MNDAELKLLKRLLNASAPDGDVEEARQAADTFEAAGRLHAAATAWDRAYGLAPHDQEIRRRRTTLLKRLGVELGGITFRYIPAGTFLMGSWQGDEDEAPVHAVRLEPFWVQASPITCRDYLTLLNKIKASPLSRVDISDARKVRIHYNWKAPAADNSELCAVPREPFRDQFAEDVASELMRCPIVALPWREATQVAMALERAHGDRFFVDLPSEAEWERAARGGLIGCRYPWGDQDPTPDLADFGHFGVFELDDAEQRPANGFGLYGMAGGVWEWCVDWYDAEAYARRANSGPVDNPFGPPRGLSRVLRGGSWADCAEALRVSFRFTFHEDCLPNIGARLVLRPCSRIALADVVHELPDPRWR